MAVFTYFSVKKLGFLEETSPQEPAVSRKKLWRAAAGRVSNGKFTTIHIKMSLLPF